MKLKIVSLFLLSVTLPTGVFGLGIRLPDQDAFATGRGEAFVATADNPSAIYYNPAGITQLDGQNVRAGFYGIYLNDHYEGAGTSVDTHDKVQVAPQLYYTYGFEDVPLTLGLGLYAPYGLSIEWPNLAPFASAGYKGSLTYLTLNPVLAWKVCPTFSIAAGPTINYAAITLNQNPNAPFVGGDFAYKGSDFAPGANVGVLWQPITQLSFGASYRTETKMTFGGTSRLGLGSPFDGSFHADAPFAFPQFAIAGVSWRPTPKWNFEFDVDWTDWHQLKTVTISATPPFGGPNAVAFNWQDSFFYEFGATYYFDNDWHVSGGYIYSENSVSDTSFNPIVPDSDRHIWSLGIGSKYKNISWDATYQLAWGPNRTINNSFSPVNGTYEYLSHAIAVSVGYHF